MHDHVSRTQIDIGYTRTAGAGSNDILVARYTATGVLDWKKTLGGTSNDQGFGITIGADGSIYVTGHTLSVGAGSNDLLLAKYRADGVLDWKKTLGGTNIDYGYGIAVGADGAVYVTGQTVSAGAGTNDLLLAKYTAAGALSWKKTIGGAGSDYGYGVTVGADGAIYVSGYTISTGAGGNDLLVAKYRADGSLDWNKTLGGTGSDYGRDIAVSSDGAVYVTGYTGSAGAGSNDVLVAKYRADGTLDWTKTLGGIGADNGYGIAASADGAVYVTGYTASAGAGGNDLLVARLPVNGDADMSAGPFIWQDATLTEGDGGTLSQTSPSWDSPDANLTNNPNPTGLSEGNAAALTGNTVQFQD